MRDGLDMFMKLSICLLAVPLFYVFAGLLVVLHSEEGIFFIFKDFKINDLAGLISVFIAAISALFAYKAADRSASAAESANFMARIPDKLKVKDAFASIWRVLSDKSAILSLNDANPEKFLITCQEIDIIYSKSSVILSSSYALGSDLSEEVIAFYLILRSELEGQMHLVDYIDGRLTLTPENQEKYHEFRKSKCSEAFIILEKIKDSTY